jgi:hypothetical protein
MAKNPRIDRYWREPVRRSEVATDWAFTLARVQWDIFATPSFKGTVPHSKIAYGMAYRWLQKMAQTCGVPYNRMLIALRGEYGEKNGRFHFHCLVGGTHTRNNHTLVHQAEWLWKIQSGGARVDVRQYDRAQAGADYVCKCLGANAYELDKYSFANSVTLSVSVTRLIRGIDASGERRCGGSTHEKTGRCEDVTGQLTGRDALYDETALVAAGMVTVPA